VESNRTQDEEVALSFDDGRREKLQRFIDDNYAFLNDVERTLNSSNMDGTVEENVDKVKDIWMETLMRKEKEMEKQSVPKPIQLPKSEPELPTEPPKTVPMPKIIPKVEIPSDEKRKQKKVTVVEKPLKPIVKRPKVAKIITPAGHVELINLSDPSEKEILEKYDELTENSSKRISDLSEMILKVREEKKKLYENSLSSSERQNSTEYLDYPKPAHVETSPSSTKDDPVSEEIHDIFLGKQRLIGMSKDSGIAMSRPGTDFRDSPDARPTEFEPILNDIPRPTSNRPSSEPIESKSKRHPPTTIKRFSPQIEDGVAHELSTIGEVETLLEESQALVPERFPEFEEHMKQNAEKYNVDVSGTITQLELTGTTGDIEYKKFPDAPAIDDTKNATEIVNITGSSSFLNYQIFPTAPQVPETSGSSSNSSLPDIVTEIKRRNIINIDSSNVSSSSRNDFKRTPSKKRVTKSREIKNISGVFSLDRESISDGTETLKGNLSQMGLNWASAMVKKTQEMQNGSSSSSISLVDDLRMEKKNVALSSTKNNEEIGKPLDLKEFMLRALMERTSNSDTLTSDSSITSSIVKSLLNISNINSSTTSPGLLNTQGTDKNVQRTSTPVATRSSNSTQIEGISLNNVTQGLFSGESRLSSVHLSSDTDHNIDKLIIPNVKLDTEKYRSSSSAGSK
jgi:anastral spindle protein 1